MKQHTTPLLKILALLYMAFPVTYLTFAALLFDIPAAQCVRIVLSPSFYVLCLFSMAAGWGLWEMKRWSWYIFMISAVLTVYANAFLVASYGQTHHKILAFVLSAGVVFGLVYRISREVRVPYFLPKIRWWENNPKYKLSVPVRLVRDNGLEIDAQILDLSPTGCFIKTKEHFREDEFVEVAFGLFGGEVRCTGNAVWRTESTVTHPKGIGVKFGPMPRVQRRVLRAVVQRLRKINRFYRSSRYLIGQEEFTRRLTELEQAKLTYRKAEESGSDE